MYQCKVVFKSQNLVLQLVAMAQGKMQRPFPPQKVLSLHFMFLVHWSELIYFKSSTFPSILISFCVFPLQLSLVSGISCYTLLASSTLQSSSNLRVYPSNPYFNHVHRWGSEWWTNQQLYSTSTVHAVQVTTRHYSVRYKAEMRSQWPWNPIKFTF